MGRWFIGKKSKEVRNKTTTTTTKTQWKIKQRIQLFISSDSIKGDRSKKSSRELLSKLAHEKRREEQQIQQTDPPQCFSELVKLDDCTASITSIAFHPIDHHKLLLASEDCNVGSLLLLLFYKTQ